MRFETHGSTLDWGIAASANIDELALNFIHLGYGGDAQVSFSFTLFCTPPQKERKCSKENAL
jgi:hypothetical protein